jgi:hypothetical protein
MSMSLPFALCLASEADAWHPTSEVVVAVFLA